MAEEQKTVSIALRLRRVIFEDAYVAVPVTDAIIQVNEEGRGSIDFDAFVAEAIQISKDTRVEWKSEEMRTEAHPIQGPVPEDRFLFDAYYSEPGLLGREDVD